MSRTTLTASVMNTLLTPVSAGRKRPETSWEKAVADVERSTGWSTTGDEQFAADLGFTLSSLAEIPRLTPFGWQACLQNAKERLENRLRIRHLFETRPEIADEPIVAPVFVVGLPRTATTLAHKVLAASDDHRGPLLWEMVRTDLENPEAEAKIIKTLDGGSKMVARVAPSWEVIHPIRSRQPEETMFVLPHGTYYLILRGSMPGYRRWFGERDLLPDFEYLRQTLQVLQHGREPKRWILKYPAHLNDMDTIRKVFPDARFVWTHRDPTTAIGSLCSLMETSWSMYQRRPDLRQIGRLALELLVESVEKGRASRLNLPTDAIIDVPYHRLNSDPHREVPKLYEALGARWTGKDAMNLANVLARPQTDRRHEYGLSRYGLNAPQVEAAFGDYVRLVDGFNSR